jgi:hypothetical protein
MDIPEVEIMYSTEVAKILHMSPIYVQEAILNHTLPIGFVYQGEARVIRKRLVAWLNAEDLRRDA